MRHCVCVIVLAVFWSGSGACAVDAATADCDVSLKTIAEDLQSARKEKQFRGLSSVLRCNDDHDLPLVENLLESRERLVVAAAAMTLAMSGEVRYREILVDRYMNCPGGPGCTSDPVYLRTAVIVACSELDLGTDPRCYELPRAPIEKMDDVCVKRVMEYLFGGDSVVDTRIPSETPSTGHPMDGANEIDNFFDLVSASGSGKWAPLLVPLLTVEYPEIRRRAALAMSHLDPKFAAMYLPPLLDDENTFVRSIVVGALAKQPTPEILAAFQRRLEVEEDHTVSVLLRIALGELGK